MDWSCYFPFVSAALLTGYGPEVTKWHSGRTHEMLHFTEGLFALPFHVLSHENKRAGPAHMEFSMCEIRSQELADSPPKMCVIRSLEDTLEIVLSSFYSSPAIWLESSLF